MIWKSFWRTIIHFGFALLTFFFAIVLCKFFFGGITQKLGTFFRMTPMISPITHGSRFKIHYTKSTPQVSITCGQKVLLLFRFAERKRVRRNFEKILRFSSIRPNGTQNWLANVFWLQWMVPQKLENGDNSTSFAIGAVQPEREINFRVSGWVKFLKNNGIKGLLSNSPHSFWCRPRNWNFIRQIFIRRYDFVVTELFLSNWFSKNKCRRHVADAWPGCVWRN